VSPLLSLNLKTQNQLDMKTIEELKAKHAAELAELEKEMFILAEIPVKPDWCHAHKGYFSCSYGKKYPDRFTFLEAFEIYKKWLPLIIPGEDWKGSSRSLYPGEINSQKSDERSTMNGEVWASITLNAGKGYVGHKMQFWARIPSGIISVSIDIQPEWKWLPITEFKYDSHGECVTSRVVPYGNGEDSLVKWWSPPGSYQLQYCWADSHNFHAFASNYVPDTLMP